ncbi:MAG TPA: SDR family NAD(P)-dependent oxidoreductase [Candidatus Angelobacter sp.]|nr:SDR family NAD(P)-dependent oxidoreductase [Candidatus Angelobacter sp.]
MMKLEGKVAVITGASMGIGEAIAKLFLKEGAKLVLCARDLARMQAAAANIGGTADNTLCLNCDVSKRDQVDSLAEAAVRRFGRIDIWVNNAGFGLNDSVEKMDIGQLRHMFDTNFFGMMECMQAAISVMRRQGGGDIVNISSVSGHIATPYMGGYGATKHAMQAIGMAARMELKRHNINVVTVCPGYISTDFAKNMMKGSQPERVGASVRYGVGADVVARDTLKAMLKRKRQAVTPWFYWIFIKLYQNAPGLVESRIRKAMRPTSEVLAEVQAKSQR